MATDFRIEKQAEVSGRRTELYPLVSTAEGLGRWLDEAQFLDDGVVRLANDLASRGRRVIIAGTDTDFRGEPFGPMPQLMCVAELVDKLHAICVLCGNPASRNQRTRARVIMAPTAYQNPCRPGRIGDD